MAWHGIGHLGTRNPRARGRRQPALPRVQPSALYNGSPASGFGSSTPVDPVRTTAKPALRLLTPPNQYFTSTLTVGVIAAANDAGTLREALGIERVTFHYEGGSVDVSAPTWRSIRTTAGSRTYFGWWCELAAPDDGTTGFADLYIEAIPRDATMQNRVIGPYKFSPQPAEFDGEITVAPSQAEDAGLARFQSLRSAITWSKQQGMQNPRITITEAGRYDIGDEAGPVGWDYAGYSCITASVPDVFVGKDAYIDDTSADIDPNQTKLRLMGPNITLDYRYCTGLTAPGGSRNHWLDGCRFDNTAPDGKNELIRGTVRPVNRFLRGEPWLTEVAIANVRTPCLSANLVRGCVADEVAEDIVSGARCVVSSQFSNHDNVFFNTDTDAIELHYSGPESSATIAREQAGIFHVTIGATTQTFDVGNGTNDYFQGLPTDGYQGADGIGGYWNSDLVNWLNTLPDVTATDLLGADADRIGRITTLPGRKGNGFGFPQFGAAPNPVDFKSAPLTLVSHFDKHGDWYQLDAGSHENIIVAFNYSFDLQTQNIFLSPIGEGHIHDAFFIGNLWDTEQTPDDSFFDHSVALSQIGRPGVDFSHVVIAANSLVNQQMNIGTENAGITFDNYCLYSHNIQTDLDYPIQPLAPELPIGTNLVYAGGVQPGQGDLTIVKGNKASFFPASVSGDYTPTGSLLEDGFAPVLPTDRFRNAFPAIAALGSDAVEAQEYVAPPPSVDPKADLLAQMNALAAANPGAVQSSYHEYGAATLSPNFDSQDQSDCDNDHGVNQSGHNPALETGGAHFGSTSQTRQFITGGLFTIVLGFTKDDASTSGSIISDQSAAVKVSYAQGVAGGFAANAVYVNNAPVSSPAQFYTALHQTGRCVIWIEGADFAGDSQLRIGRNPSMVGFIDDVIVIDEAAHAATLAEDRALAQQAAEAT